MKYPDSLFEALEEDGSEIYAYYIEETLNHGPFYYYWFSAYGDWVKLKRIQ